MNPGSNSLARLCTEKPLGIEQSHALRSAPALSTPTRFAGSNSAQQVKGYRYSGGAKLKTNAVETLVAGSHLNPAYSIDPHKLYILKTGLVDWAAPNKQLVQRYGESV